MANATTVKGLLTEIIDVGIPVTSTSSDVVSVEQSDKTKLKGTMELSAGAAIVGKVSIDQATANANEVVVKSITAGSNIVGKVGIDQTTDGTTNKVQAVNATMEKKEKPFRGTAYFSRPADANAYTALDAITNSTSAPAIMTIDLSSYGVVAGDFIAITNVRVVESTKLTSASVNAWIFPSTFTPTNDNAELALSDAEAQVGGVTIPCSNIFTTANNTRMVSDSGLWLMQISVGTSIYCILQAASGFTPGNNSRYDVFIEGVILK